MGVQEKARSANAPTRAFQTPTELGEFVDDSHAITLRHTEDLIRRHRRSVGLWGRGADAAANPHTPVPCGVSHFSAGGRNQRCFELRAALANWIRPRSY